MLGMRHLKEAGGQLANFVLDVVANLFKAHDLGPAADQFQTRFLQRHLQLILVVLAVHLSK